MNKSQDHEKLFDEICSKLNELSSNNLQVLNDSSHSAAHANNFEKMQNNLKKFQNEITELHGELVNKIKSLEEVSYSPHGINDQLKQLSEQLSQERANNTRLSTDLAKSLEMCLQMQLEIQSAKAKTVQIQTEERKYSLAVVEKNKELVKDLELANAMKDDIAIELAKAKNQFHTAENQWKEEKSNLESQIDEKDIECTQKDEREESLTQLLEEKNETIKKLYSELEQISAQFSELEVSAKLQNDSLKNLMTVAENKIVEIKVALDKKSLECDDYVSHLQKSLTQVNILKQENVALKDYISKLNYYVSAKEAKL